VFLLAAYPNFDKLFVVTLKDRGAKKRDEFKEYPNIEIKYFE
jgi:hypothetical protein